MTTAKDDATPGRSGANGQSGGVSGTMSGLKDQASTMAQTAKDQASSMTKNAKDQLSSVAEVAKQQASALVEPLKEKAMEVKDKALEMAEQHKATGAEQIGRVASVVHAAADQIEKEIPQAAGYIHRAAEGLEQASSAIRSKNVGEIVDFVEGFARRNPAAFFGTSILAGFVLSRFLKSSSERRVVTRSTHHEAYADGTLQQNRSAGDAYGA